MITHRMFFFSKVSKASRQPYNNNKKQFDSNWKFSWLSCHLRDLLLHCETFELCLTLWPYRVDMTPNLEIVGLLLVLKAI